MSAADIVDETFGFFEKTYEGERMSTEIPIWVNGKIQWLAGIDKKTTCKDVVEVLLQEEGIQKSEFKDFTIMERWRKVERPLDENSKILKIWSHWGNDKKEVRLCLRRIDNEVDSGRGSPVGTGHTPSLRRKRNRVRGNGKPPWAHQETLHPRRLAELGRCNKVEYENYFKTKELNAINDSDPLNSFIYDTKVTHGEEMQGIMYNVDSENTRKKSGDKSYHCSGTGRLHSTPNFNQENHTKRTSKCCSKKEYKQKIRNSETIEKLMKLILAQGATIQNQLQKLKEREEQIESLEHERHRERIEKNGRNYLLETYLGSLKDAEIPFQDEEKEENIEMEIYGENDHYIYGEKKNSEELIPSETELNTSKCIKTNCRNQVRHKSEDANSQSLLCKTHQKGARSKSESRTHDGKGKGTLKRTLSDNTLLETSDSISEVEVNAENNNKSGEKNYTKENEVVELRKIQNQIEMWEKVFKINKKLEKEEENLVRLYIKIKKYQCDNQEFAKENSDVTNKMLLDNDRDHADERKSDEITDNQDCAQIQKILDVVNSDLQENSKEIHKNLTKLMNEDEIIISKKNHLSKLMLDLERTNHENEMLNEMIASKKENRLGDPRFLTASDYQGRDRNSAKAENYMNPDYPSKSGNNDETFCLPNKISSAAEKENLCTNDLHLSNKIHDYVNQRKESEVSAERLESIKPKIVKISFEDQIHNFSNVDNELEKSTKDALPVVAGALKSILKNKTHGLNKMHEKPSSNTQIQKNLEFPKVLDSNSCKLIQCDNLNPNSNYVKMQNNFTPTVPDRVNIAFSYTNSYPVYTDFSHKPKQYFYDSQQFSNISNELKTGYSSETTQLPGMPDISKNVFPHRAMVTTKATIHNDTDSSTSSDTSGLSSMYSSSPTVEEPFAEQTYVLDTLV